MRRSFLSFLPPLLGFLVSLAGSLPAQKQLQLIRVPNQPRIGTFGESTAISGNLMAVGASDERVTGNYAGAVYVYKKVGTSWVLDARLTAPVPTALDRFGSTVALSGSVLVVGAPAILSKVHNGRIHIFRRKNGKWTHEAQFERGRWFGVSISISGNRVVSGAPGTRHSRVNWGGNNYAGAVWVFRFNGTKWVEEAKLLAGDPGYSDHFGSAVAIQGNSLLIGASGDSDEAQRRYGIGSVYAFDWNGSAWVQSQKFRALKFADQSFFGAAISWDGNEALIGSPGKKANGTWGAGAAYLFHKGTGGWVEQQKWTSPWPSTSAAFGRRVVLKGGLALIGHQGRDAEGNKRGAIHVWRRSPTNKWIPEPPFQGRGLVGKYSDFNGGLALDGNTLVAGGYIEDNSSWSGGAAWVFDMSPAFHLMVLPLPVVTKDTAKFELRFAPKNAVGILMFGFTGTTKLPLPWPGTVLRLNAPMIIGAMSTGTKGKALWEFNIPAVAQGVRLWTQALEIESFSKAKTSNLIYTRIRAPF
ncbi:MAG TPA: hypothetical protein ENK02_04705 [Planctomycetes bacterium]|nr:hypothetical protein [Planctomycetota bacterium]